MPLNYLALVARGACIPGLHGTNNWKDSSGQVTTPGQYTATETSPVCLWKRCISLSWSFSFRDMLQLCCTFRGYRGTLRECRQRDTIFVSSIILVTVHWYLTERSLYSTKALFPATVTQRRVQEIWRTSDCSSIGLCIFAHFKSCYLQGITPLCAW